MKKQISLPAAHLLALVTIFAWGTSFIASKILLASFSPVQIMLMRFVLAYAALWIVKPKPLFLGLKQELGFLAMGVFGCSVYFMCENTALTFTLASNVSIIVAAAPILTAVLAHFFIPGESLNRNIFLGFVIAIVGVALVVFNGTVILKLNPLGDLLSLAAALCWAIYSVFLRKNVTKFDNFLLTRRIMLWGLITALPMAIAEGRPFEIAKIVQGSNLFCVLYLGLVCSAACYVFWNVATKRLGTVTVSNYIYVVPFFTMLAGVIILKEPVSAMGVAGALLIVLGVFVSDRKKSASKEKKEEAAAAE